MQQTASQHQTGSNTIALFYFHPQAKIKEAVIQMAFLVRGITEWERNGLKSNSVWHFVNSAAYSEAATP